MCAKLSTAPDIVRAKKHHFPNPELLEAGNKPRGTSFQTLDMSVNRSVMAIVIKSTQRGVMHEVKNNSKARNSRGMSKYRKIPKLSPPPNISPLITNTKSPPNVSPPEYKPL